MQAEKKPFVALDVESLWEILTRDGYKKAAFGLLSDCFDTICWLANDNSHVDSPRVHAIYREVVMRMLGDDDGTLLPAMMNSYGNNPERFRESAMKRINELDMSVGAMDMSDPNWPFTS